MRTKITPVEWEKLQDSSARTGLSVSEVYRRCMTEEVLSVHIVKPGRKKGVRLVNKQSLDDFIRSFLPGGSRFQKAQPAKAEAAGRSANNL
jgi:hypothetical protein